MNNLATIADRDAHAERIRELSSTWTKNTIELGKEFLAVRDSFPENDKYHRPGWHKWIEQQTRWTARHVTKFIQVYERLGDRIASSSATLNLTHNVLDLLATSTTPEAGVNEVLKRAKSGEKITRTKAEEIVKKHLPTRAAAIKEARETGRLVAARDGHLYSGATEDEMAAYSERRSVVYAMRRAADAIADVQYTPQEWIALTEPHWIAEFNLGKIDAAIKWLKELRPLLAKEQKVVSNGTR